MLVPGWPDCGEDSVGVAEIDRTARFASRIIMRVPSAAVGVAISAETFQAYLSEAPESFPKAVLRESVLHVPELDAEQIRRAVETRLGHSSEDFQAHLQHLAGHGASAELVERFTDAWKALQPDTGSSHEPVSSGESGAYSVQERNTTAALDSDARSAAEAFLFELLEHTPDLAGLFELNAVPGFLFGGQPAEIDLACVRLRIAIEIDGYYHFNDLDGYRRDRRKDFELQQQGYLVLRFLAEDVVARMESICESIRAAVRWRQSTSSEQ